MHPYADSPAGASPVTRCISGDAPISRRITPGRRRITSHKVIPPISETCMAHHQGCANIELAGVPMSKSDAPPDAPTGMLGSMGFFL